MINETENNPLLCDTETGMCASNTNEAAGAQKKPVKTEAKNIKLIYFTDPICSSCWGIEPQLRKLKLEYGAHIDIEYRMGGLLPNWSYNNGGISKPSDVAHHWDEVSVYYDMPIDGDLWLVDPMDSSYPPSIAFKAAQLQSEHKAILLLREMREMLFLKKKNLASWTNIATAALKVGLDVKQLKIDVDGRAINLFEADLKMTKDFGVSGFPTIFVIDSAGNQQVLNGSKPYAYFETAILKMNNKIKKTEYNKSWETLFSIYPSLTAKEFSVLSAMARTESETLLNQLSDNGQLDKLSTKNGALWTIKQA